jgi:hypothetical protein
MQDLIKEFAEHCDFYVGNEHSDKSHQEQQQLFLEKFAEMIEDHVGRSVVAKCAEICDVAASASAASYEATRHKEIGAALVARGAQVQAERLSAAIKEHFELDNKLRQ